MNVETAVQRSSAKTQSVEQQLLAAVERSELRKKPFDHIYMEALLQPEDYEKLLNAMPEPRFYHDLKHRDALRPDGTSTRQRLYLYPELIARLSGEQRRMWMPVARALCSMKLQMAFKRKFRTSLEERFKKPAEKIGMYPVPILLRDQPGYRIGIHSDVPTKAITVQFYLPRDASQRNVGTIFHESDQGEGADRTTQMPFMPASGYAFPVSLTKSWHSAATVTEEDGERITMMVTYYVADGPRTWLKYRIRRALLRFGIHPER